MKEQISGAIDLAQLADAAGAQTWYGAQQAESPGVSCVLLGRPHEAGGRRVDALRLLQLWAEVGIDLPQRLRGEFALALLDVRRQTVLLAVDRFARQSLCYRLKDQVLAFSDRA